MADQTTEFDRRASRRYHLHLPIHYRISDRGSTVFEGTGTTTDMSTTGLSFRCRKPLPVGAHVELAIDWPPPAGEPHRVELQATGFIIRGDRGKFGVRVHSHRFIAQTAPAAALSATA